MNSDEQWLADLLKRAVPQPPRQLTHEEITVRHRPERSRKGWAMPALAAAAVLAIGVALGAAATRHPGSGVPNLQGASGPAPVSSPATPPATPTATPTCGSAVIDVAPSAPGDSVTVPDLEGQQLTAAGQALVQLGLDVRITTNHTSAVPAGTVTQQSPAPGMIVPRGATVMLYVSDGGRAAAPTFAPATGAVSGSGCGTSAPSVVPTGPASSSTAALGQVRVPSSIGMSQVQAEQSIIAAGFRVIVHEEEAPGNQAVPPGTVWKQDPAAATTVAPGTTITIAVQPMP